MSLLNGTPCEETNQPLILTGVSQSHSRVIRMVAQLANDSNALCCVDPQQPLDLSCHLLPLF